MNQKLIDKFWSNVQKGNPDECWIWIGSPSGNGYGQLRFEGVTYRSNVLSYLINKGNIPARMYICHTCDNPICVNPNHLFVGTPSDNAKDRQQKGRGRPMDGENNSNNRFTKESIIQMRSMFQKGYLCNEIAHIFDTNPEYVRNVVKRKVWKDL